jgi:hypothetical protein
MEHGRTRGRPKLTSLDQINQANLQPFRGRDLFEQSESADINLVQSRTDEHNIAVKVTISVSAYVWV